jgi:hypothetical protein
MGRHICGVGMASDVATASGLDRIESEQLNSERGHVGMSDSPPE